MTTPKAGDVLRLTREASPQFGRTVTIRFVRFTDRRSSVSGWAWLEGYVLDSAGDATAKRSVFVNLAGLEGPPASAPGCTS